MLQEGFGRPRLLVWRGLPNARRAVRECPPARQSVSRIARAITCHGADELWVGCRLDGGAGRGNGGRRRRRARLQGAQRGRAAAGVCRQQWRPRLVRPSGPMWGMPVLPRDASRSANNVHHSGGPSSGVTAVLGQTPYVMGLRHSCQCCCCPSLSGPCKEVPPAMAGVHGAPWQRGSGCGSATYSCTRASSCSR